MRSSIPVVLGVLAGGVGGIVLGAMFFGGGGGPGAASNLEGGRTAEATTTRTVTPDAAPVAPAAAPIKEAERAEPRVTSSATSRGAPAPSVSEARAGELSIGGRITTADNEPVSGVTIRMTAQGRFFRPSATTTGKGFGADRSLDDAIAEAVEQFHSREESRIETTTNADGLYRFDGLLAGEYRLDARREGYVLTTRNGSRGNVRAGTTLNFKASPVVRVPVQIIRSDGGAVREASVRITVQSGRSRSSNSAMWTPDDPHVYVSDGSYELKASIPRTLARELGIIGEWASDSKKIFASQGTPPEPLTLTLEQQLGVRGTVIIPDDATAERVTVKLTPLRDGVAFNPKEMWSLGGESTTARTYNGWQFSILGAEPGRYGLLASTGADTSAFGEVVEIQDQVVERNLTLPEIDAKSQITVRVRDEQGMPVIGVSNLQCRVQSGFSSRSNSVRHSEAAPGEYRFTPDANLEKALKEKKKETKIIIIAGHNERGEGSTELVPGLSECTIVLKVPAILHLTVTGITPKLEGRLTASIREKTSEHSYNSHGNESVPRSGSVEMDPIQPGVFDITVSAKSEGSRFWSSNEIIIQPVTLVSGDNYLTVALPPMYSLTVRVPGEATNHGAQLTAGDISKHAQFDDGVAVFSEVPAGRYTLQVWGGNIGGRMTVDIPSVSDVTFQADVVDCALVKVTSDSGWLAKHGFQDGDKIITVAGNEFTTDAEWQVAWSSLLGKDRAMFTVLRSGNMISIEVDAKAAINTDRGGSIVPGPR